MKVWVWDPLILTQIMKGEMPTIPKPLEVRCSDFGRSNVTYLYHNKRK